MASAQLYVPVLFVPGGHVFVGLGPYIGYQNGFGGPVAPFKGDWALNLGLGTILGGWF